MERKALKDMQVLVAYESVGPCDSESFFLLQARLTVHFTRFTVLIAHATVLKDSWI